MTAILERRSRRKDTCCHAGAVGRQDSASAGSREACEGLGSGKVRLPNDVGPNEVLKKRPSSDSITNCPVEGVVDLSGDGVCKEESIENK